MTAIHVRNIPEPVVTALRERAMRHGHSMQQEVRQILQDAAAEAPPREALEPLPLTTVRTSLATTWRREEIYDDKSR